jgi:ectoine hydroxylase-related dioxygenase (phytanoyl-CoA dioxygenase family)
VSATLDAAERAAFDEFGVVRIERAFDETAAAAMRDVIWRELGRRGVDREDRGTWTVETPQHLQHLKRDPAFTAIGTPRTLGVISDVLDGRAWSHGSDWGAMFVTFPVPGAVPDVPTGVWHIDAPYGLPARPLFGVKVFTLVSDLEPGAGGTMLLAGSHRVLEQFGRTEPASVLEKNARARRALMRSHPFFSGLGAPGDPAERVDRFMRHDHDVDGVPVRVLDVHGRAGDIWLVHQSTLHARPTNTGTTPRFMLAKDVFVRARAVPVRV